MNMTETAVSVIVPVYNTEPYLEECLGSILNQSLKEIEVICVDDGSTDGSAALVERMARADGRIHLLTQENKGGGAARNLGMSQASGKYLTFLDSDDFFEPDMLEQMYLKCEETKADVCVCKARCYHQDLGFYTEEPAALREEMLPQAEVFSWKDMASYIFNAFHNWPWNKMFLRGFAEERGLRFQEIKRTNDLLFTCTALMEARRITVVKKALVNYRVGVTGTCQTTNAETPLDFYHAFLALQRCLQEKGVFEQVRQSYVNHALDGCIANLNSQENNEQQEGLYDRLKSEIFRELSVGGQGEEYFYPHNRRMFETYQVIVKGDYPAYLRERIRQLKQERDDCLIQDHREKEDLFWSREYQTGIQALELIAKVPKFPKKVYKFIRGLKNRTKKAEQH